MSNPTKLSDTTAARLSEDELDRQLQELAEPQYVAPSHLAARIIAQTAAVPHESAWSEIFGWLQADWWRSASALVIPIALGFGLGQSELANSIPGLNMNNNAQYSEYLNVESLVFADTLEDYQLSGAAYFNSNSGVEQLEHNASHAERELEKSNDE